MSLRQMQIVVKTAEERSFTKAAKKLKIAQPSLSQSILNLEAALGTALFDRKNPLSLTHAGEIYVSKAKILLKMHEDLHSQIMNTKGLETGVIHIGLSQIGYNYAADLLPKFCERFPRADIKIIQVFSLKKLEQMINESEIDIGIFVKPENFDGFDYDIIKDEEFLIALPVSHPLVQNGKKRSLKKRAKIRLSELKDEKFIIMEDKERGKSLFYEIFKNAGFSPKIFCETESFDIANAMVASGVGVCFTLEALVKDEQRGRLALFSIDEPLLKKPLILAYKKSKIPSKLTIEFINMIKNSR